MGSLCSRQRAALPPSELMEGDYALMQTNGRLRERPGLQVQDAEAWRDLLESISIASASPACASRFLADRRPQADQGPQMNYRTALKFDRFGE